MNMNGIMLSETTRLFSLTLDIDSLTTRCHFQVTMNSGSALLCKDNNLFRKVTLLIGILSLKHAAFN